MHEQQQHPMLHNVTCVVDIHLVAIWLICLLMLCV